MSEKKRHLRIDSENNEKILSNMKLNKSNYTQELNSILKKGFGTTDVIKKLDEMIDMIKVCQSKLYESTSLTKQLYSDMDFPERTNPKESKPLKDFYSNYRKDKYND